MSLSRRELLKLGASSFAYVVGANLFFGSAVRADVRQKFLQSDGADFLKSLPAFEGIFIFDPEGLKPFADDFGHWIHKVPHGVLKPANAGDVQKISKYCAENKIKLTMRGTGGAAYGQTQLEAGFIIDSSSLKSIRWLTDEYVELAPGLIWKEVLNFTILKKRSVPVMPDTIVTSVGGKVNVGGIGETSYNRGSIADQVVEFDLVTTEGLILTCNQNENAELFTTVPGSMGQFGLIVRIVMKTMPAPDIVYTRQFKYDSADERYLADLKTICHNEKNGAIGGHLVRNADGTTFSYVLDVTSWTEENPTWLTKISATPTTPAKSWSFFDYANRNTKSWFDSVASGGTLIPHPYMSFYLPFEKSNEMALFLQNQASTNFGATRMMLSPLIRSAFHKPSFKLPDSEMISHFRIYRLVKTGEGGPDHMKMLASNENEVVPKVMSLDGKVYLPFSPLLNAVQIESHFGPLQMRYLKDLKAKQDPNLILNSGAHIF